MRKILVVDDVIINRMILSDALSDKYEVDMAENGDVALKMLEGHVEEYGLVLLDLIMPVKDGFAVLDEMNRRGWSERLPVIVISGDIGSNVENRSLQMGATDYIRKPFNETVVRLRADNTYQLFELKRSLEDKVDAQTEELRRRYEQIESFNDNMVDLLGTIVEYRHLESGDHVHRVKTYTELLANEVKDTLPEYGLDDEAVDCIAKASVLHDLGKVTIPDSILLKPGRLTKEEFDVMKTHTVKGGEFIEQIQGTWDEEFKETAYNISRHHHERYDGRGYPDGLVGDEIPISAQIVSIADVFDALTTDRVYKKAFTPQVAHQMILDGECGVFSPKLIACMRRIKPKFFATVAQKGASLH